MKKTLKGIVSKNITITAFFKEDSDGKFTADCPEIPGCTVTGRTQKEARQKIKAAVEACFDALLADAWKRFRQKRIRTAEHS